MRGRFQTNFQEMQHIRSKNLESLSLNTAQNQCSQDFHLLPRLPSILKFSELPNQLVKEKSRDTLFLGSNLRKNRNSAFYVLSAHTHPSAVPPLHQQLAIEQWRPEDSFCCIELCNVCHNVLFLNEFKLAIIAFKVQYYQWRPEDSFCQCMMQGTLLIYYYKPALL